jgi:hypothetical protein
MEDEAKDERQNGTVGDGANVGESANAMISAGAGNAAKLAQDLKSEKVRMPPPSPAHRAVMAQKISQSLAPPPKATSPQPLSIGQTEIKKTKQSQFAEAKEQEHSIEIDLGEGKLSSRHNPLSEKGEYVGKMPPGYINDPKKDQELEQKKHQKPEQKKEPVVLEPQARQLSSNAARLIAKRRAMMEGQDQAGSFKLPRPDPDTTNFS